MISCVILTACRKNINRTLKSVQFCDEILILKDSSVCGNKEINIENKKKIRIVEKNFKDKSFSQMKNFGLSQAEGDWILFVDDDEVVTDELRDEIIDVTKDTKKQRCFYIKRREIVGESKEVRFGEVWKARKIGFIRLVSKNSGQWNGMVHEVFRPNRKTKVLRLSNCILHFSHDSIADFISKINLYSTIRAREFKYEGKKVNVIEALIWPFLKFIYTYFILLGCLDGYWGFVYSFMMSFHSFLVRAKSLEL